MGVHKSLLNTSRPKNAFSNTVELAFPTAYTYTSPARMLVVLTNNNRTCSWLQSCHAVVKQQEPSSKSDCKVSMFWSSTRRKTCPFVPKELKRAS